MHIAIFPVARVYPSAIRPPFDSCATSQNVIPAFGNKSDTGINAEPIIPNAFSMPCICSTFTKASSVVIFVITYFPLEIFLLNIYISLKQSINKAKTNIWI